MLISVLFQVVVDTFLAKNIIWNIVCVAITNIIIQFLKLNVNQDNYTI
jgi:hypothetical protein